MLSGCVITGNGTIKQTINLSSEYFIALGNFNNQDVTVNYPVSRATELPKCFCGIFSLVTEVSSGRCYWNSESGPCSTTPAQQIIHAHRPALFALTNCRF